MRLSKLKRILLQTPFDVIIQKDAEARRTRYRFYRRSDWTYTREPEMCEVLGVDQFSYAKAIVFAEGVALGYVQKRLVIMKGETNEGSISTLPVTKRLATK